MKNRIKYIAPIVLGGGYYLPLYSLLDMKCINRSKLQILSIK